MSGSAVAVAVSLPVGPPEGLTYAVSAAQRPHAVVGTRVRVSVGRQRVVGLVVAEDVPIERQLRFVEEVLDKDPVVTAEQLAVCRFVAQYYHVRLGDAVRLALPPDTARRIARYVQLTEKGSRAQVFGTGMGLSKRGQAVLLNLEPAQRRSVSAVRKDGVSAALLRELEAGEFITVTEQKGKSAVRVDAEVVVEEGGAPLPHRAHALAALDAWLRTLTTSVRTSHVQVAFPGSRGKLKRLAELGRISLVENARRPDVPASLALGPSGHTLRPAQAAAVAEIGANPSGATLLEGVTGSGKTEVYLRVLRQTLDEGRGAIFVVPEIGLTPQLYARVQNASGEEVALLHSGMSMPDRRDALARLRQRHCRVALGARSALFAPVHQLGLIVVDEEHDSSLKQDEAPRYHARDVALWRARAEGARCILGSATPALETRFNAERGKLAHAVLSERVHQRPLPAVQVVDLRARKAELTLRQTDRAEDRLPGVVLSAPLRTAIAETLEAGDQVLLFLNRRGYSGTLLCEMCGEIAECPDCAVTLTVHKGAQKLQCHQCGFQKALYSACLVCRGPTLTLGVGTERVEAEVERAFPDARRMRFDRDTITSPKAMVSALKAVQEREVDIIIGTQMVAKGHDFPGIALVGVVSADVALSMPDFRASERAFQLLTQVAGRAGRGERPGRVMVQTYRPEHPAVVFASHHDTQAFAAHEIAFRESLLYPPFSRLALLRVSAEDETVAFALADRVARTLTRAVNACATTAQAAVLGPAPAPLSRLRGQYRVHLLVRTTSASSRRQILLALEADEGLSADLKRAGARLVLDVDPISML